MPIPPREMEMEREREREREPEWERRLAHEEVGEPPHRHIHPLPPHEEMRHSPPPKPMGITHEDLADMIDAKFERLYVEIEELKRRLR